MPATINVPKDIEAWMCGLGADDFARVVAALDLLATRGSGLGRPLVGPVYGRGEPGLKEIRPNPTGRADLRILFRFDPGGDAVLLEAGEARTRCRGRHARDGGAVPGPATVRGSEEYDWEELRAELVIDEEEVAAHRVRMLAEVVGSRLAEIRRARQLLQKDVAKAIGVRPIRVARIEDGRLDRVEFGAVRAYVEALGGRLTMRVDFDDQRVLLC